MTLVPFPIDRAYFTSNNAVGNTGGTRFLWNVGEGAPVVTAQVRSLLFWADSHCVRGVQMKSTNDKTAPGALTGKPSGKATSEFYFSPGERVTSLTLWSNNFSGGRLGGVEIKTDRDRSVFVKPRGNNITEHKIDVGSGMLVGLFGNSGNDLDCLGFALLHRVHTAQLSHVQYTDLDANKFPAKPAAVRTILYDNKKGTTDQTFTFSGSETITTSSSWSVTTGMTLGIEFSVQASTPVYSASAKTSLELSVSQTHKSTEMKEVEESFSFPLNVPAGKKVQARAIFYEGNVSLQFTAKMVYGLITGACLEIEVQGTYDGIANNQSVVEIEDITSGDSEEISSF